MKNLNKILPFLAVALVSAPLQAPAQNLSAFQFVEQINGVDVVRHSQLEFEVTLHTGAEFELNGNLYPINFISGFFLLREGGDLGATATSADGWDPAGDGFEVFGFRTPPGQASVLEPGESHLFTLNSLNEDPVVYGFHVGTLEGVLGDGNTGYIQPVPEPGTLAVIGIGLTILVLAQRRRR